MKYKKLLRILISALILGILIYRVEPSKIVSIFSRTSGVVILLIFLHYFLTLAINSLNFFILLRGSGERIKFREFIILNLYATALGQFSPGRLGELSIAKMLKKRIGTPFGKVAGIYFVDKSVTLTVISTISLAGIILLFPNNILWFYSILVLLLLVVVSGLLLLNKRIRLIIRKNFLRKYETLFTGFYQGLRLVIHKKRVVLLDLLLTFFRAVATAFLFKLMFWQYDLDISLILLMVVNAISLISFFIPISFSGIGIKESIVVFLLGLTGFDPAIIAAVHLMLTTTYLLLNGLAALVAFNRKEII